MTHDQELNALITKWREDANQFEMASQGSITPEYQCNYAGKAQMATRCAAELEALQAAKREPVWLFSIIGLFPIWAE